MAEETPANKIATAQAVLSLALRLNVEARNGRISEQIFNREVTVITGNDSGVLIPAYPEGTRDDLLRGMENFIQIALSASALTLDETLIEVFGKLDSDTDSNRFNVRVLVHQLRNAFAHNPWRPRWSIFPKYQKLYPVELDDGSKAIFDARNIDGSSIKPEQFGGLEFWVNLLQHCEREVSKF